MNRINLKKMEAGVKLLLQGMSIELDDPNFRRTPQRVARMFAEMLTPRESNWAIFPTALSDLILLRGHRVVALCPHHLLPVELTCHVAYIPNRKTVGLSKLARVVEVQLTRPITQEDLADAVANSLNEKLEPKGVGVVIAGVHGCMRFRGVETEGDVVVSVMKGVLLLNPTARHEFLRLIGRP
jgi:GTP cyclohydrolase I